MVYEKHKLFSVDQKYISLVPENDQWRQISLPVTIKGAGQRFLNFMVKAKDVTTRRDCNGFDVFLAKDKYTVRVYNPAQSDNTKTLVYSAYRIQTMYETSKEVEAQMASEDRAIQDGRIINEPGKIVMPGKYFVNYTYLTDNGRKDMGHTFEDLNDAYSFIAIDIADYRSKTEGENKANSFVTLQSVDRDQPCKPTEYNPDGVLKNGAIHVAYSGLQRGSYYSLIEVDTGKSVRIDKNRIKTLLENGVRSIESRGTILKTKILIQQDQPARELVDAPEESITDKEDQLGD